MISMCACGWVCAHDASKHIMALCKNASPTLYELQVGRGIIEGISNLASCHTHMHSTACTAKFTPLKKMSFSP